MTTTTYRYADLWQTNGPVSFQNHYAHTGTWVRLHPKRGAWYVRASNQMVRYPEYGPFLSVEDAMTFADRQFSA